MNSMLLSMNNIIVLFTYISCLVQLGPGGEQPGQGEEQLVQGEEQLGQGGEQQLGPGGEQLGQGEGQQLGQEGEQLVQGARRVQLGGQLHVHQLSVPPQAPPKQLQLRVLPIDDSAPWVRTQRIK